MNLQSEMFECKYGQRPRYCKLTYSIAHPDGFRLFAFQPIIRNGGLFRVAKHFVEVKISIRIKHAHFLQNTRLVSPFHLHLFLLQLQLFNQLLSYVEKVSVSSSFPKCKILKSNGCEWDNWIFSHVYGACFLFWKVVPNRLACQKKTSSCHGHHRLPCLQRESCHHLPDSPSWSSSSSPASLWSWNYYLCCVAFVVLTASGMEPRSSSELELENDVLGSGFRLPCLTSPQARLFPFP